MVRVVLRSAGQAEGGIVTLLPETHAELLSLANDRLFSGSAIAARVFLESGAELLAPDIGVVRDDDVLLVSGPEGLAPPSAVIMGAAVSCVADGCGSAQSSAYPCAAASNTAYPSVAPLEAVPTATAVPWAVPVVARMPSYPNALGSKVLGAFGSSKNVDGSYPAADGSEAATSSTPVQCAHCEGNKRVDGFYSTFCMFYDEKKNKTGDVGRCDDEWCPSAFASVFVLAFCGPLLVPTCFLCGQAAPGVKTDCNSCGGSGLVVWDAKKKRYVKTEVAKGPQGMERA